MYLFAVRKENTRLAFSLKAGLAVALLAVLVYDGWLSFQPQARLTLAGYAKVLDGDTLLVCQVTFFPSILWCLWLAILTQQDCVQIPTHVPQQSHLMGVVR